MEDGSIVYWNFCTYITDIHRCDLESRNSYALVKNNITDTDGETVLETKCTIIFLIF